MPAPFPGRIAAPRGPSVITFCEPGAGSIGQRVDSLPHGNSVKKERGLAAAGWREHRVMA